LSLFAVYILVVNDGTGEWRLLIEEPMFVARCEMMKLVFRSVVN